MDSNVVVVDDDDDDDGVDNVVADKVAVASLVGRQGVWVNTTTAINVSSKRLLRDAKTPRPWLATGELEGKVVLFVMVVGCDAVVWRKYGRWWGKKQRHTDAKKCGGLFDAMAFIRRCRIRDSFA